MSTVFPIGVSGADLEQAIDAFKKALGAGAVITGSDDLKEFRDPYSYRESDEFDASAVVMPTTTEQVQQVVRIANSHGVPLSVFSQGRNNTYGGSAPRHRGSVIVNLRNMNQVLEI